MRATQELEKGMEKMLVDYNEPGATDEEMEEAASLAEPTKPKKKEAPKAPIAVRNSKRTRAAQRNAGASPPAVPHAAL